MKDDQNTTDTEHSEASATETTAKPRRFRRRLTTTLLVLLPIWWFCFHTPSLRVSKETTYVLGPMMQDGKRIDYFRAFEEQQYPPEMQTDENGYRSLIRNFGLLLSSDETTDRESYRQQIYEKLDLNPDIPPLHTIKYENWSPWDYVKRLHEQEENEPDEKLDERFNELFRPWTLQTKPEMKDWLDKTGPLLDQLAESVRKPAFCMPMVRFDENESICTHLVREDFLQRNRTLARAAAVRANYRIGTGDIDGAIDDILTCHRLGRHTGKQGTLVMALVGLAIEGYGFSTGIASNPDSPPSKEQLERFFKEFNELPPRVSLEECLNSERLFSLAGWQEMLWGKMESMDDDPFPLRLPIAPRWYLDPNIVFRRTNQTFDAMIAGSLDESSFDRSHHWTDVFRLPFVRTRTNMMADTMMGLSMPSFYAGAEAFRRVECSARLQRLTLTLLLYEKDHGKLTADDWRQAVRPYLRENADEIFCCPSSRLAEDETTYALIRHESGIIPASPNAMLLVETWPAMNMSEGDGTIPASVVRQGMRTQPNRGEPMDGVGSFHPGGFQATFRNGAVRFVNKSASPEYLSELIDGTATKLP